MFVLGVWMKRTRKTGHVHTVGTLDLGDDTVGARLGHQGSEEDNSRVVHLDGCGGVWCFEGWKWLRVKELLMIELS